MSLLLFVHTEAMVPPPPFVFPSLPTINRTALLPGSSTRSTIEAINFQIVDDDIGLEDEEVIFVNLTVINPDMSGVQATTEVAVLDNECKALP